MMRLTLSSLSERFVLLRSLEQSKLGELSLATDQALSQPVLLLQLAATLTPDDDTLDAIVADNLRLQASPDVLLTRAWFRTTEGTFLVTEAGSDGQLVSELIRLRDKVEMPQLLAFAAALARAAASASRVQIAHLDLGPHRAWLEGGSLPGPVRVFGWGWSRLLPPYSNGAEAETFYGHPDYLAAELCKGLPASATADVYSAATAVWSLAAGKPPFLSAQPLMTVKRQSVEKPLRLDLVKPALKGDKDLHALLVEALDKDPAKRPGADAFLAAIAGAFATWAPELSPSSSAFPVFPRPRTARKKPMPLTGRNGSRMWRAICAASPRGFARFMR
jgi:serine/threonine-protein kinase